MVQFAFEDLGGDMEVAGFQVVLVVIGDDERILGRSVSGMGGLVDEFEESADGNVTKFERDVSWWQ